MLHKYKNKRMNQAGFTLLELLMVIAVIAILAAIATTRLQDTTGRARFVEVINSTSSYKLAVEMCALRLGKLEGCTAGVNGIPANAGASASGAVNGVSVGANGVITATGGAIFSDEANKNLVTYELKPAMGKAGTTDGITWTVGGSCQASGLC